MGFDPTPQIRYATDQALASTSIVGRTQYSVYLYTVYNEDVALGDTTASRHVTTTRILMADGFRTYAATSDGYLNPMVTQKNGQQIIVSNGGITANEILLGPLVFPYNVNNLSSGIDPTIFQPALGANNNVNVIVQIQGQALNPNGNFFTVDEIVLKGMDNIIYSVLLKATSQNPKLT